MATKPSCEELEQRVKYLEEEIQRYQQIEKETVAGDKTENKRAPQEFVDSSWQYRQTLDSM